MSADASLIYPISLETGREHFRRHRRGCPDAHLIECGCRHPDCPIIQCGACNELLFTDHGLTTLHRVELTP